MIQIETIIVTRDPLSPERLCFELTFDEVQESGEAFFRPGFTADVFLTDGSSYNFVCFSHYWESCAYIDEPDGYVLFGEIRQYKGTFEFALDQLLTRVNMQPSKN